MADELTIKDVVALFGSNLRTEEQLKTKLLASEKEELANYIIELLQDEDIIDEEDDEDDEFTTDAELPYND